MQAYLGQAEQELARVTEIVKHTLRYYREPNKPVDVDVAAVVESVLALYHSRLVGAQVSVVHDIRCQNVTVLARPGELRQVVANLVGNSLDAMRAGGKLQTRINTCGLHDAVQPRLRFTLADTLGQP